MASLGVGFLMIVFGGLGLHDRISSTRVVKGARRCPSSREASSYAFGIDHAPLRGHEQLSHSGSVLGHAAHLLYRPGPDVTVVILRNRNDGREYEAMASVARQLATMALGEAAP